MNTRCFVLLDDHRTDKPRSRLYQDLHQHHICEDIAAFPAFLERIEQALQQGFYSVILWHYELGEALHGLPSRSDHAHLAEALIFMDCQHVTPDEVNTWLQQQAAETEAHVLNIQSSVTRKAFIDCINRIHAYIEQGDTYQVNYTFRLRCKTFGAPLSLYQQLKQRQSVPYGAYIQLPDDRVVLSFSPELFVEHHQQQLTARPMKGTAKADSNPQHNALIKQQLQSDPKNQAENLMIVDLLRNDLGRIAQSGSVHVPDLFSVNQYGQVWQMTSTVSATTKTGLTLLDMVKAIYPCGSITGAPKHRTMQIIQALESTPRGLYTGAIGWLDPVSNNTDELPNYCLSVPIRTLLLSAPDKTGFRQGEMGIGAGIVYDSDAASEYEECLLKGSFLTGMAMNIGLIETMYATRDHGCRAEERHLSRMQQSAAALNIPFSASQLRQLLLQHQVTLDTEYTYRVRVLLSHDGQFSITAQPFTQSTTPVTVFLVRQTIHPTPLFAHKTTDRTLYNATLEKVIEKQGFDALFFNERGELTEGCRSNVFVRVNGQWCTPPVSSGLLPGIMRQQILEDPHWQATERVISREEVLQSTQIMVCNALHGPLFVHLDQHTVI